MTEHELGRWVHQAERGESFVYAVSRCVMSTAEEEEVRGAAMRAAMTLNEKGLVALVQRRVSPTQTLYIAQRTWTKDGKQ
jgi:hypothetical protein